MQKNRCEDSNQEVAETDQNPSMFGKRFKKELDMVNYALENEMGEKAIRKHLKPYVESVVEQYINENKLDIDKNILMKAGWTHLGIALKKYKERAEKMLEKENTIYYFSTYFNWYIRQGMIEYLNSKSKA